MCQQCGLECLPCERPWYQPLYSATVCCFLSTKLLFLFTFTRSKPPVYLFARPGSIILSSIFFTLCSRWLVIELSKIKKWLLKSSSLYILVCRVTQESSQVTIIWMPITDVFFINFINCCYCLSRTVSHFDRPYAFAMVAWWRYRYDVGFANERSWVQFPARHRGAVILAKLFTLIERVRRILHGTYSALVTRWTSHMM